jgi:hypothetical protein
MTRIYVALVANNGKLIAPDQSYTWVSFVPPPPASEPVRAAVSGPCFVPAPETANEGPTIKCLAWGYQLRKYSFEPSSSPGWREHNAKNPFECVLYPLEKVRRDEAGAALPLSAYSASDRADIASALVDHAEQFVGPRFVAYDRLANDFGIRSGYIALTVLRRSIGSACYDECIDKVVERPLRIWFEERRASIAEERRRDRILKALNTKDAAVRQVAEQLLRDPTEGAALPTRDTEVGWYKLERNTAKLIRAEPAAMKAALDLVRDSTRQLKRQR